MASSVQEEIEKAAAAEREFWARVAELAAAYAEARRSARDQPDGVGALIAFADRLRRNERPSEMDMAQGEVALGRRADLLAGILPWKRIGPMEIEMEGSGDAAGAVVMFANDARVLGLPCILDNMKADQHREQAKLEHALRQKDRT